MGGEGEEEEEFGKCGNGEGNDEGIEIEVFKSGFGEVPGFGAVERWVFEVQRGGEQEAPETYGEQEEER